MTPSGTEALSEEFARIRAKFKPLGPAIAPSGSVFWLILTVPCEFVEKLQMRESGADSQGDDAAQRSGAGRDLIEDGEPPAGPDDGSGPRSMRRGGSLLFARHESAPVKPSQSLQIHGAQAAILHRRDRFASGTSQSDHSGFPSERIGAIEHHGMIVEG